MFAVVVSGGARARVREFVVAVLVVLTAASLLAAADATPAHAQTQDDDSTQAAVESVAITSSPQNDNDTYGVGEIVEVTATFDQDVTVQDGPGYVTPHMLLRIGDETLVAAYSGTDGAKVKFRYTVVEGNSDEDGIAIPQNALEHGVSEVGGSGSIRDAQGRIAELNHDSVADSAAHKVDAVLPTISSVRIVSRISERAGGTYGSGVGDRVEIVAAMSEVVTVDGAPQIELDVGGVARLADYYIPDDSAYGTSLPGDLVPGAVLAFRYTVAVDDNDLDGVSIGADKITLNGGSVADGVGNAADLSHDAVGAVIAHAVSTPPVVESVVITSLPLNHRQIFDNAVGTYGVGQHIDVTVTFDQDVTVSYGPNDYKPVLVLEIGDERDAFGYGAEYVDHQGAEVRFRYTVRFDDLDEDGVAIRANSLLLGVDPSEELVESLAQEGIVAPRAAKIRDAHGTDAIVAHDAVPASESHMVDAVPATILNVTIQSSPDSGDAYGAGEEIKIVVETSEVVVVEGDGEGESEKFAIAIELGIGGESRLAAYVPANDSNDDPDKQKMVFVYRVEIGDSDDDGVSVRANSIRVDHNNSIKDRFGNDYDLSHPAVANHFGHRVSVPGGL